MAQPKITIIWDKKSEEAVLSYSPEFDESYPILKADMLKDAIHELIDHYNSLVENLFEQPKDGVDIQSG